MSALVGIVCVCVCVFMYVSVSTQGMCVSLHTYRLLYTCRHGVFDAVRLLSACVSPLLCMLCVCVCVCARPLDTLRLVTHLACHDQGLRGGQVCSLLALATGKTSRLYRPGCPEGVATRGKTQQRP